MAQQSNNGFYLFKVYVCENAPNRDELIAKYNDMFNEKQIIVNFYRQHSLTNIIHFDAGIDIYTPEEIKCVTVNSQPYTHKTTKLNSYLRCSMYLFKRNGEKYDVLPTGYQLYPRSSTGSKTPLRMTNSVGIIDSGYRGHIMAHFDNVSNYPYTVNAFDRLLQICASSMEYPIYPVLVHSKEDLDNYMCDSLNCYPQCNVNSMVVINNRGDGGFGSTGK